MMASSSEKREVVSQAAAATELYVYLEHAIGSGPLIYSLFEIALPNPLPRPPTAAPPVKVKPLPNPNPILQLKLGEYPRYMCCVRLGSKFYLFGGKYDDLDLCDDGDIDEEIKKKYSNVTRDDYPRDVYIFDPTTTAAANADADDDKLMKAMMMNTGKSKPVAFVVDEKIYVLGSTFTFQGGNKIKNLAEKEAIKEQALFEMYDPSDDKWTVLPNPPPIICDIENKRTEWVGHAVDLEEARKRVLLLARQGLYSCLYSFDLDGGQWIKCLTLPGCPANTFIGRCELVGGFLYGHSYETVAAFKVPLAAAAAVGNENLDDDEEIKEKIKNSPEKRTLWEMTLAAKCPFYHASKEMGMDAIYIFPQQLYSSSSLLHLGNGFFCFVLSGMPPHPYISIDQGAVEDYKKRVISIVIFQNPHVGDDQTEEKYFKAKFVHSAHYVINSPFPIDGRIRGCFSLGQVFDFGDGSCPTCAEHANSDDETQAVSEIIKQRDMLNQDCIFAQTEIASLRKAWDLLQEERQSAERLLQEERQSAERRLQDLQREHEMALHSLRMDISRLTIERDHYKSSFQAIADPVEPESIKSSSQPTKPLASNLSGDTSDMMETLHLS